jgi:cellulose binding protein with CBM2 domain
VSGQDPDPLEVVLDPAVDEQYADSGKYRGRRRHLLSRHRPARRWASAWGLGTVLATIGVLLVGSGVLARTLATARPDLPPLPPSPSSSAPELLEDRAAAGDRSDRPAPHTRSSPTAGPADEQPDSPSGPPERDESGDAPEPTDPGSTAPEPSGAPRAACSVEVDLDSWRDGYLATFTITNQGEPLDGWTMTLTVPDEVRLDEGWNGRWSQQGTTLTVENAPFNGSIGTGQSVVTGHSASHDGDVSFTGFVLNGAACATS